MEKLKYSFKTFMDLSLTELYQILKIRQEVFIVEQNCPYLDADDKDFFAVHVMGKNAHDEIHAYTRLLPVGISYSDAVSIGRVLTSLEGRRLGWGKELMQLSIDKTKELFPTYPIKISAQEYLIKFYTELGFRDVGKYYMEDDIPHLEMILSE